MSELDELEEDEVVEEDDDDESLEDEDDEEDVSAFLSELEELESEAALSRRRLAVP